MSTCLDWCSDWMVTESWTLCKGHVESSFWSCAVLSQICGFKFSWLCWLHMMCLKKTFHVRPSSSGQYAGVLVRGFKGFLRAWLEKLCWPVPWFSTFDFGRCFTISFQQNLWPQPAYLDKVRGIWAQVLCNNNPCGLRIPSVSQLLNRWKCQRIGRLTHDQLLMAEAFCWGAASTVARVPQPWRWISEARCFTPEFLSWFWVLWCFPMVDSCYIHVLSCLLVRHFCLVAAIQWGREALCSQWRPGTHDALYSVLCYLGSWWEHPANGGSESFEWWKIHPKPVYALTPDVVRLDRGYTWCIRRDLHIQETQNLRHFIEPCFVTEALCKLSPTVHDTMTIYFTSQGSPRCFQGLRIEIRQL